MSNIHTDLAIELREINKTEGSEIPGVIVKESQEDNIKITVVDVTSEEGERIMGKAIGRYITIDLPKFTRYDRQVIEAVEDIMSKQLLSLLKIQDGNTVLVVGLGNWNITPDSLGPKVISKLMVTRHLKQLVPDALDEGIRPVCAVAPGVLGLTGIETSEIIKGVVEKIKPDLVICIDALASRKLDRVNSTIQISNTGISPGSGVGNKRMEISSKTLGVPVISIGVPTVVDAATIANDTIDLMIDEMIKKAKKGTEFYSMIKSVDKNEKQALIQEILNPFEGNLMVTPKEVDTVIESISKIIANGINLALHKGIDLEYINDFLN
ncbi:MAG TPA: GPR endopeptidase [Clostridiaceae bacterium]